MTPHQLHLLDIISTSANMAPLHPEEREAVRAILAEREELLRACLTFTRRFVESNPTYSTIAMVQRVISKASDGDSCGQ